MLASTQSDPFVAERNAIMATLRAQRVKAKPTRPIVTPAFVLYPLQLHPEETIHSVERAMPQVALQVSNLRRAATHLRLQHPPLVIEAPHPHPSTLAWPQELPVEPHSMLAGRGYTFAGPEEQRVKFDESPHVLIAGITGSGKSVLAQGMALSLAMTTSPADVRYMVVDLKRDDLVPLQGIPHTVAFAGDPDASVRAINAVYAEMERRRDAYSRPAYRLVLWIDELAQLPTEAQELLKTITALGRSMEINVVAATQHPTAEVLGGSVGKINYTTRLVGLVADATAAATATGRSKTGAEMLPGRGSFIRVEGPRMVRFQSYLLTHPDVRRMVRSIRQRWNGVQPAPMQRSSHASATVETPEVTDDLLADVFAAYHDGEGGLMRGGMMAAIRAAYGDEAATGGRRHQEQRTDVLAQFDEWLSTQGDPSHDTSTDG